MLRLELTVELTHRTLLTDIETLLLVGCLNVLLILLLEHFDIPIVVSSLTALEHTMLDCLLLLSIGVAVVGIADNIMVRSRPKTSE